MALLELINLIKIGKLSVVKISTKKSILIPNICRSLLLVISVVDYIFTGELLATK